MLERSFRNLLPSLFQVGKLEAQNLSSSQPLYYRILRLTINHFQQKGIQLHIQQRKQSHQYSFGRVNFGIGHLPTLQPHTECWRQGIHFPHFQRCRAVSPPTEMPRILQGKRHCFYNETNPKTATQIPQNFVVWELPAHLWRCTKLQPWFNRV